MGSALATGTVLAGRYEIVEALDRGGHGIVYRAKQRPLGREVAVKVMLPEVAAGPGMAQRFAREVSLVQRLEHPNTVRLYDFGATDDGTAFMVFELLRGRSLESEMAKGPMTPVRVAKITVQILKSLMEAHGHGIVHRDVKPANVLLVDYSGEPDFVKVLDFGVARPMDEESRAITRDGQLVGTPSYMAPEQVRGEPIGPRTDLYALGIVMGEMLSGQPIFANESAPKIWMQQASAAPVPIPALARASVLGAVIERATRKDAQARFVSSADMITAIESAMRGQELAPTDPLAKPVIAAPPARPQPTVPFASAPPPARTPLVHTRPPPPQVGGFERSQYVVLVAGGILTVLLLLASAAWQSVPHPPPAIASGRPVTLHPPFDLRKRAEAEGWTFNVAELRQSQFFGTPARIETYQIIDSRMNVAGIYVAELDTDERAVLYEASVSTLSKVRSGRYVVVKGFDNNPFCELVFRKLTR